MPAGDRSAEHTRSTRMVRVLALGAGLAVGSLAPAAAPSLTGQLSDASRIVAGDSLRIRMRGALWMDASFESWRADVMMLGVEGIDGSWPVSIFDLQGLELYTERTPREGLRNGALIGSVGGLFLGAVTGLVLHRTGVISTVDGPPSEIVTNALTWAGIGIVAGGIGGAVYGGSHPGTGWVVLSLPAQGRGTAR